LNASSTFRKLIQDFYNSGPWMFFYGIYASMVALLLGRFWPENAADLILQVLFIVLFPVLLLLPLIPFWFFSFERYITRKTYSYHDSRNNRPLANPHITGTLPIRLSLVTEIGSRVKEFALHIEKPDEILIRLLETSRDIKETKTPKYGLTVQTKNRSRFVFFFELKQHARRTSTSTFELCIKTRIGKWKHHTLLRDSVTTSV
jgi:hypothetical protein